MKIAIDARMYGSSQFSGIGTYIQRLTDELFKIDKENQYILFFNEPEYSKFECPNERVEKVKVDCRHYSYAEQVKFPLILKKYKFDLIHYPHFNSPVFCRKKSVCTIHDVIPFEYPGHKMKSKFRQWAYRRVFKSTVNKAETVIAVSEATKKGIVEKLGIKSNKIKVVYEGVDERFRIMQNSGIINNILEQYKVRKPYIFFIGVWRSHKNVEGLVKAFNILKKKYKVPHNLLLGGREDLHYTKVRDEINKSDFKEQILTTGFIEDKDLPVLYNAADLFVIPSFIEGFGLIGIEAQNCGTPVVSSNTSSLPEVLEDSALYFDPKNEHEMADVMYKVLRNGDLKEKLVNLGKDNLKRFDWEKCARETLDIYKGRR